jgi:hypothetical protein
MVAVIPTPPSPALSNDLHGVEHEDAHFSVDRKIPGCNKIKKHQLRQ